MEEASGGACAEDPKVAAVEGDEEEEDQEDGASASLVPEDAVGFPAGRPPPVLAGADWSAALSLPETESWLAHMSGRVAQLGREVQRDVEGVRTELHLKQFKEICVEVSGRSECVRSLLGTEFPLRLLSPACAVPGAVRHAGQRWHQLRVSLQVLQERLLRESNGRHPPAARSLRASMVTAYWDDNKKRVFQEVIGNIDTIQARETLFIKSELPIGYNNVPSDELLKSFEAPLQSSCSGEGNPDFEKQLCASTNLSTKREIYETHFSKDLRMEFSELPWPSKQGKKEDNGECSQVVQALQSEQLVQRIQTDTETLQERSAHQLVPEQKTTSALLNESQLYGAATNEDSMFQSSNVASMSVDGNSNNCGTDYKSNDIVHSDISLNAKCRKGLSENRLAGQEGSSSVNKNESACFDEAVSQGFSNSRRSLGALQQNTVSHGNHHRHEVEVDEEEYTYSPVHLGSIHSSMHRRGHSQMFNGSLKDLRSCLHYRAELATSNSRLRRSKSVNMNNLLPAGESSFRRFHGTKASSMQSVLSAPETIDSFSNRLPLSSSRYFLDMEYEAMLDFAYPLHEDGRTREDTEELNDLLHQIKIYENHNPTCNKLTKQQLSTPFLRDDRSHERTFCTAAGAAHDVTNLLYVGEGFKRPPQGESLSPDHISAFKVMPVSCRGKKRNHKRNVTETDDWYGSDEYLALPTQLKEAEAVAQNLENLVDMLDTSSLYRSSLSIGDLGTARSIAEDISSIRSQDAGDLRPSHKEKEMGQSKLSVSLPHERPRSVCDSVESGPLCDIMSDGMSPVQFSTSSYQGGGFCGSLNEHQNLGSESARSVQQTGWKPRDASSPVSEGRPPTLQNCGRHQSQLIKEIQDDIEHQINNTAIWEKIEMFVKKLDVLIDWLYDAMETTENWTPPKAEIDNLKVYLETHLCFKLNVDSHCALKEEVVQEGRRLLEILVSQKSGLRDTLDRIESQWQQLQQQICRQHGWVQRALAIIKSDVLTGAEALSERGGLEIVAAGASQSSRGKGGTHLRNESVRVCASSRDDATIPGKNRYIHVCMYVELLSHCT
ncbi:A-kinase anchor protein 6-like isoform X1 [Lethenteron reissneri]|uniref:A-kinase anchor protein 6-like isoform X1 n=1 Tax=Lethenteron reissneri TaxID=7753 RepID=UPI002AB77375|nr:A-kinase anchor protein 6-like isoform X1 [Lethenteron reissneri]XP_061407519.1 A-kinase anchor protein 6-like isoform X1 [Lethenteron reissneri]XP_061407520.1 A-kinase anchor protein 6-like isoform X1 [Lethenteron reissneri]